MVGKQNTDRDVFLSHFIVCNLGGRQDTSKTSAMKNKFQDFEISLQTLW